MLWLHVYNMTHWYWSYVVHLPSCPNRLKEFTTFLVCYVQNSTAFHPPTHQIDSYFFFLAEWSCWFFFNQHQISTQLRLWIPFFYCYQYWNICENHSKITCVFDPRRRFSNYLNHKNIVLFPPLEKHYKPKLKMKNIFVLYSFNNAFFTPTKLNVDRKKKSFGISKSSRSPTSTIIHNEIIHQASWFPFVPTL